MPSSYLAQRQFIRISGEARCEFLQNLITCEVEDLPQGLARAGALLTPQGKILFDFLISKQDDALLIEVDATSTDALLKRLMMYKLRAAVELSKLETTGVSLYWDEAAPEGAALDERFEKAGIKLYRIAGLTTNSNDDYTSLRIDHGIAESGDDYALQDAFPHDTLMDVNGGVSFKKGCFVGQEVVSRMKHRGTARKRVMTIEGETTLPESGTEIVAGGKPIGTLGSVTGTRGLGIVRIDRLADALSKDTPISAGGVLITAELPSWSGIALPVAEANNDTSEG